MNYGDGVQKPDGTWDFYGHLDPNKPNPNSFQETFSIGIFQWVNKKNGDGTKRSKVIKRVRGWVSFPEDARQMAKRIVEDMNAAQQSVKSDPPSATVCGCKNGKVVCLISFQPLEG
jgi:hypothetical protein